MIRTIAVDLGGVLFAEGKAVALDKLAQAHGYAPEIVGAILSSPQSILLRKGLMSDQEFWQWVQQQLPRGYDSHLIRDEWYNGYVLDQPVYDIISKLRKNFSLLAFSGNIESRVAYLENKYHFRHLFDIEVYSFDFHMTKPERAFVEKMIEKAGVAPEEILYIDDNDLYAKPARELGVNVIIYKRGEHAHLRRALKEQGVEV